MKSKDQLDLFTSGKYNYRHRVYNRLAYDLKTGKIEKEPGYLSGYMDGIEAHHPDIYNDPDFRIWLTKHNHLKLHDILNKLEDSGFDISPEIHIELLDHIKENYCKWHDVSFLYAVESKINNIGHFKPYFRIKA